MGLVITIIDDEARMGDLIARALQRQGHTATAYTQAGPALEEATRAATPPDVVLTDLKMPGMSGMDVLEQCQRTIPNTTVVLMTAYASAQSAIEALRKGAYDYLIKPFPMEELEALLERLGERAQLRTENRHLRAALTQAARFRDVVAESPAMRQVIEMVRRVAPTDATVMLRGESGTGKEVVATAIHAASGRSSGPLIKVNCGAIPENLLESELFGHVRGAFTGADRDAQGYFQAADGGTLFLDEIGELPLALQVKLLRALQDGAITPVGSRQPRPVNVRIVAATNRDLEAAMEAGEFREDLYYRIHVVPISLPPLRQRREDITALIDFFHARLAQRGRSIVPWSAEAIQAMLQYAWPGNVRELQNAVEHASVMATGHEVTIADLPVALRQAAGTREVHDNGVAQLDGLTLEEMERLMIVRALELEGGNQTHAARRLGITRRTLGYRMARHGIAAKSIRGDEEANEANEPASRDHGGQ